MFFRILKKDLKRKKTMNIILLLFITIATTFLASSVNNLTVISGAVDYYLDKSVTPDYTICSYNREEDKITKFLMESKLVKDYELGESISITKNDLSIEREGKLLNYDPTSTIILQKQPQKYMQVFDESGSEIKLGKGEIAVPIVEKNQNYLKIGEKIIINLDGGKKEFTITNFVKDAACGSNFMGIKRLTLSNEDYDYYSNLNNVVKEQIYAITTDDVKSLEKSFKKENIATLFAFDRGMVEKCYIFDMLISAILIIVSICLILISFLILRFTIVSTLQEDYKEIGIMKAIGLKNKGIKGIYLIKYLAIAIIGSFVGCMMSYPFSRLLLNQVSENLLMDDRGNNVLLNILCSLFVVFVVIVFCYTSTRKLNKFSAVDSIRNGTTGERFNRKSLISLKNRRSMKTELYLAINDIFSNIRSFIVLILTFVLGTILIILPLNSINTLKDGNIITMFGMAYSDIFVEPGNLSSDIDENFKEKIRSDMEDLEKKINSEGIPIDMYAELIFSINCYGDDKGNTQLLYTMQAMDYDGSGYEYIKGDNPKLENEIALTEISSKKMNVDVGDTIYLNFNGHEEPFIVTGLFQSMNMMGEGARINSKVDIDYKYCTGINSYQGNFINHEDIDDVINKLKNDYPHYKFNTPEGFASKSLGGIIDQIDNLKNIIVLVVLSINGLITILMMKTFIKKDIAEIAILKSIGFKNKNIRLWQSYRIVIILTFSIILGVFLAQFIDPITTGKIFAVMGANHIKMTIVPEEVYIFYPLVLLVITSLIAFLSTGTVKKVELKEINNME